MCGALAEGDALHGVRLADLAAAGRLYRFRLPDVDTRVVPGDPAHSALVVRMSTRATGLGRQMPPLATEVVDDAGVSAVSAWIAALPSRQERFLYATCTTRPPPYTDDPANSAIWRGTSAAIASAP